MSGVLHSDHVPRILDQEMLESPTRSDEQFPFPVGIAGDGYLFRTAAGKTGMLTEKPLTQPDAYRMVQRRAKAAGIETRIGNHTFRATGITAYLKNSGKLEVAQHIANHESPRTTKLYDRRQDEILSTKSSASRSEASR